MTIEEKIIDAQIRAVQERLGLKVDGDAGPKTWAAIHKTIVGEEKEPPAGNWVLDKRSKAAIDELLPEVRPKAIALLRAAYEKLGATIVITTGYRSDAEQNALYAQGRTKPGKIVTWVKAPRSWHQHRVGFDGTLFVNGKPVWESPIYAKVGKLAQTLGIEWPMPVKDVPHFQMRNGKTIDQAIALRKRGLNVFSA